MYKIHITTRNIDKHKYITLMQEIGIKCAILLLDSGETHQMTSVRSKDFETVNKLRDALWNNGLYTERVKVECIPNQHENYCYLEAHFDGIVPLLPYAVNIAKENPILSSTARSYSMSLQDFTNRVNIMAALAGLSSPEIEGILFDDNESLDSLWMKNLVLDS